MKKILLLFLAMSILLCVGCKADSIPANYPSQTAIDNGDVVTVGMSSYNVGKLASFIDSTQNGKKDSIRITRYTTEGDPVITTLTFDGKTINYTNDTTRDHFGNHGIVKKQFDSIYLSGGEYHVKNASEDFTVF